MKSAHEDLEWQASRDGFLALTGDGVSDLVQEWTAVEITIEILLEEIRLSLEPTATTGSVVRCDADRGV
jgi:hypothetical protein